MKEYNLTLLIVSVSVTVPPLITNNGSAVVMSQSKEAQGTDSEDTPRDIIFSDSLTRRKSGAFLSYTHYNYSTLFIPYAIAEQSSASW